MASSPNSISINLAAQQLTLLGANGETLLQFPISSGAAGIGFEENSGKTPTGRFVVCSTHGENAPLNTWFIGRLPRGTWPAPQAPEDAILSRILCLDGLDEANANTRARFIYIHGTPHTATLGTPVSHGCIRLAPAAMAQLFELSPIGTLVEIH